MAIYKQIRNPNPHSRSPYYRRISQQGENVGVSGDVTYNIYELGDGTGKVTAETEDGRWEHARLNEKTLRFGTYVWMKK